MNDNLLFDDVSINHNLYRKGPRAPFAWYGGKYYYAEWIISHFCGHRIFIEPFGGAGNILLNKIESKVEIFNDLDSRISNFYRVLRNCEQFKELVRLLNLTPYSREEFTKILESTESQEDVQEAYKFFVKCRQSMGGLGMTKLNPSSWVVSLRSRRNMAEPVSKYLSAIDGLEEIASRYRSVVIENDDVIKIIHKYDREDALIYCDPPYVPESRHGNKANTYGCEMTPEEHLILLQKLKGCKGKVVISGYHSETYDKELTEWNKDTYEGKSHVSNSGQSRTEVLWKNF